MITNIDPSGELVIVDDDLLYTRLVELVLRSVKYPGESKIIHDPSELIPFLTSSPSKPRVVLLDVNMPQMSGLSVLKELRSLPQTKATPVVIMSGIEDDALVKDAFIWGANSWIRKPNELDDFFSIFQRILEYWYRVSSIPRS